MESMGGVVPSNQATIQRGQMKQKKKHLEHRRLPINEDACNNKPKRGIDAEEENEEEV